MKPNDQASPSDVAISDRLSKRDCIAAMALQGILSDARYHFDVFSRIKKDFNSDTVAKIAVAYADALLNALEAKDD